MELKEIFIICNSEAALAEISSGRFPDLDKKDLFTCNNAFTFFRTTGRHLNFWTDTLDIIRHIEMPETLSKDYQKKVHHIYSQSGMKLANGNYIYQTLNYSQVKQAGSSALNALAFLSQIKGIDLINQIAQYDVIWLIGYTLDEGANEIWNKSECMDVPLSSHTFKYLSKNI